MRVKIRHFEEGQAVDFTDISHDQIDDLIAFIKRSGGVFYNGDTLPFNSYQIVLDDDKAYVEILIGEEE